MLGNKIKNIATPNEDKVDEKYFKLISDFSNSNLSECTDFNKSPLRVVSPSQVTQSEKIPGGGEKKKELKDMMK